MNQIFTRTGDQGYTGMLGKHRIPKNHPRIEAIGAIDEAMAALGLARATSEAVETAPILLNVQRDLYRVMTEISATPDHAAKFREIDAGRIDWLEKQIRQISESVQAPKEFILPGDSISAAVVALARTIVRRAERHVAGLMLEGELENDDLLRYLNRLSSLCFTLELLEIKAAGGSSITMAKEDHT